jgi:hypothetical protein
MTATTFSLVKLQSKARSPEFRQLIQYVGMGKDLEPHHLQLKPISETKLFLLTSDGVHNMPKDTFQQLITNAENVSAVVERLITHSEWIGGRDNATVVAISTSTGFGVSKIDSTPGMVEIWGTAGNVEFWGFPPALQVSAEQNVQKQTTGEQLPTGNVTAVQEQSIQKESKSHSPRKNRTKPDRTYATGTTRTIK